MLFMCSTFYIWAQSVGDCRSYTSGPWSSVNSWESWNGASWVNPAAAVPGPSNNVTVLTGYTIKVDGIDSCNNLKIDSGGVLIINENKSLTVLGALTNYAGSSGLIIRSGKTGTGNLINGSSGVYATVQRCVPFGCFCDSLCRLLTQHFVSSPINSASYSCIYRSGHCLDFYYPMEYNESNTDQNLDVGWIDFSGTMGNGKGYCISPDSHNCMPPCVKFFRTYIFSGTLNIPPLYPSVSWTYTATPWKHGDPQGWNLVGNPFPCALNAVQFLSDNSGVIDTTGYNAVYLFDNCWDTSGGPLRPQDYASINHLGTCTAATKGCTGQTPNGNIALGQGFFIKVKNGTSSVSFVANQQAINTSETFFIPDVLDVKKFWLHVSTPGNLDNSVLLGFLPGASKSLDRYDAIKLKANKDVALYTILGSNDLIIQGLPPITEEIDVPLGLDISVGGEYQFDISQKENFDDKYIYLLDKKEGKLIDLVNNCICRLN